MSVTLTVGGKDLSPLVISLHTEQDICRLAQTFELDLSSWSGFDADPWDDVVISINGTKRLTGYIDEAERVRGTAKQLVLRGKDTMKRALDTFITDETRVEEELDAGYWIDYWLDDVGITTSGSIETGRTIPKTLPDEDGWLYISVSDIILECLGYAGGGYTVIVDADGVAQITEKKVSTPSHTISSSLEFSRSKDDSWYRDRAVVFGTTSGSWVDGEWVPGEVTVVGEKPDDPPTYPKTVALSSSYIQSQTSADNLAQDMLDFYDETLDIKRFLIDGDESIWLGESASWSESWTQTNGTGLITSIETTIDDSGFRQLVSLDEKCGFIWGWGDDWVDVIRFRWLGSGSGSFVNDNCHTYHSTRSDFRDSNRHTVIAADSSGDFVAVCWNAWTLYGTHHYYCITSDDAGQTWSNPVQIDSVTPTSLYFCDVAIDSSGSIYVVYESNDNIRCATYSNDLDFIQDVLVDDQAEECRIPEIEIDSNDNIYVMFLTYDTRVDPGRWYQVRLAKSTDRGGSFGASTKVSGLHYVNDYDVEPSPGKFFIDASDNLHIVYQREISGAPPYTIQIHYRKSTDGGSSWSSVPLAEYTFGYYFYGNPSVYAVDNYVIMLYRGYCADLNLHYYLSDDSGATWTYYPDAIGAVSLYAYPHWSLASMDMTATWSGDPTGDQGDTLYVSTSDDHGVSWNTGIEAEVIEDSDENLQYPCPLVISGDLHCVYRRTLAPT